MMLVKRGMAGSYQEVLTFWDIDEVMAAIEILELLDDAETSEVARMKAARK